MPRALGGIIRWEAHFAEWSWDAGVMDFFWFCALAVFYDKGTRRISFKKIFVYIEKSGRMMNNANLCTKGL